MLRKSLWGFRENRIAVRFQYEWHDADGQWFRSYGNELWEFDDRGLCAGAKPASTTCRSAKPGAIRSTPDDERGPGHDILRQWHSSGRWWPPGSRAV